MIGIAFIALTFALVFVADAARKADLELEKRIKALEGKINETKTR